MLVFDRGSDWQLVRQPDHADLSGAFARAWGGGPFAPLRARGSVELASTRHDDGWAVYDRRPGWDAAKRRPRNFLDVPVRSHLAFYRACIQVVTDEDPYAGLLVSMHGAGIYNGRYGTQPSLMLTHAPDAQAEVDTFVAGEEATHAERAAAAGAGEEERWVNYRLLQVFDRLSLALCLRDWETEGAVEETLAPVPTDDAGGEVELRLEPLAPWRIRIDPYPFAEQPARFRVVRKVLPKADHGGNENFRRAYAALPAETVEIAVEA